MSLINKTTKTTADLDFAEIDRLVRRGRVERSKAFRNALGALTTTSNSEKDREIKGVAHA